MSPPLLLLLSLAGAAAVPVTRRLLRAADNVVLDDGTRARDLPARLGLPAAPRRAGHPHRRHLHKHRARNVRWLKEALIYLREFGYLRNGVLGTEDVWSAIAAFQEVGGLRESGRLDLATLQAMRRPRCGNHDLTSSEEADFNRPVGILARRKRFAQVSSWDNIDAEGTLRLKWFIQKYTSDISRDSVRQTVRQAFQLWAEQVAIPSMHSVTLEFQEATSAADADITILWARRDHGDAYAFDGAGNATNILAHTFYPNYAATGSLNGDIHFDEHEKWTLDGESNSGVHFPYVLVHEIGHALGLGHSKRQEAVMNPIYKKFSLDRVLLDVDDKCAMHWNYVGPSKYCLFVWLMVELLPRARDSNLTAHGIAQVTGTDDVDVSRNDVWADRSLEQRLNFTLQGFQTADIPSCAETNDVQDQYEVMLEQQLSFPPESAREFGPVVCNFLEGLSNFSSGASAVLSPARRRRASRRQHRPVHARSVHSWPSSGLSADEFGRELSSSSASPRRRRRSLGSSVYDKDFFSADFFRRLLHILIHSPAKPRSFVL